MGCYIISEIKCEQICLLVDLGLRDFLGSRLATHISTSSCNRKQTAEFGGVLRCLSLIMQTYCLICLRLLAVVVEVLQSSVLVCLGLSE